MKLIRAVSILLLATFLVSCNTGTDKRYLDASLGGNLELPPDLSEPQEESEFELPAGFSGAASAPKDRVPVLAKVESLRLEGSGDLYWLNVEEPVDNLYQLVKNFWLLEGYRLIVDEPVIGIMQTDWILTEQGPSDEGGSWFAGLFSDDNLALSQDQYRSRIESDQAGNVSRIYIAHRGTESGYSFETGEALKKIEDDDNPWRFRQPEPELEVEMLSRLMVFLGLQKDEVEQQVAKVGLFSPRASRHIDSEEKSPYLILKDPYQIAWNRIYHQLERMNFEIDSEEYKNRFTGEGEFIVNLQVTENQEKTGLFSFFSSSDEIEKRQIRLVLTEESHQLTRIMIQTTNGNFDTSSEGAAFLDLIYKKIR